MRSMPDQGGQWLPGVLWWAGTGLVGLGNGSRRGKGGKQILPSAHPGCASLVQGDMKTLPSTCSQWAMPQASRDFPQGGKLESTEVLESGHLDSFIW